jgi:hypothetical protein
VASYTAECAFEFSYPGYVGFRKWQTLQQNGIIEQLQ